MRIGALHANGRAVEINIADTQGDKFTASQSGQSGGEEDCAVLLGGGTADERVYFLDAVEIKLVAVSRLRRRNVTNGIDAEAELLAGVLEDSANTMRGSILLMGGDGIEPPTSCL